MKKAMKVLKKGLLALALMLVVVGFAAPKGVYAASKKENNIKKLVSQMGGLEYKLLLEDSFEVGESRKIKLTNAVKAQAAILAPKNKVVEEIVVGDEDEWYNMYEKDVFSEKTMKKKAKNMFGKSLGAKYLPKFDPENPLSDIGYNDNGKPVICYDYMERDLDYKVRKVIVSGSTVYEDVFYGYWGYSANNELANFRITYTVKKNSKSAYGYVISSMKIEKTADETTFADV